MNLSIVSPLSDSAVVKKTAGKIVVELSQKDWYDLGGSGKAVVKDSGGNIVYSSTQAYGVRGNELTYDLVWPEVVGTYTITVQGLNAMGNERALTTKTFTVKD